MPSMLIDKSILMSRKDVRTQPGVLTPGYRTKGARPHKALRSRPRPRIRPRGVMECWSIGVLRQVRIAPRVRGVGDAEGAVVIVLRHSDITKSLNQSSAVLSGRVRDVDSPGVKTLGSVLLSLRDRL